MASNECNQTEDCLGVGSQVPRVCFEQVTFSERENFCDCSSWYGWTGEACDVQSRHLRYSLAVLIIISVWCSIVILLTLRTLSFHVREAISSKKTSMNPVFYTGLLVFFGTTLLLIYNSITLPALIDPSRFQVTFYTGYQDITPIGGKFGVYCFFSLGTIYTLISAQIILSWYDVIAQTAKYFPDIMDISPEKVKKGVKIFMVAECLISLVLLATGALFLINVGLILIATCVLILQLKGGSVFVSTLRAALGGDLQNVITLVSMSYKVHAGFVFVGLFMTILVNLFYLVVDQDIKPGTFNYITFSRDIVAIAALSLLTFDSWYVHRVSKKLLHLNEGVNWLPHAVTSIATSLEKKSSQMSQKKSSFLEKSSQNKLSIQPVQLGEAQNMEDIL